MLEHLWQLRLVVVGALVEVGAVVVVGALVVVVEELGLQLLLEHLWK